MGFLDVIIYSCTLGFGLGLVIWGKCLVDDALRLKVDGVHALVVLFVGCLVFVVGMCCLAGRFLDAL